MNPDVQHNSNACLYIQKSMNNRDLMYVEDMFFCAYTDLIVVEV